MSETITDLPQANSIDATQDWMVIDTANVSTTHKINRNTLLNLSSQPVGLTDSQTLTNKTLTSPSISSPTFSGTVAGTYTIGGTPTFPSNVVQLTSTQTLTNKTLTSPTINSPTITNATISADTLSGFTNSNAGTVYGMSVSGGLLASAAISGQVNAAAIASNAVLSGKLGLSSTFTGGVASQANAGTAGGTMYYINLGGMKILWGSTTTLSAGSGTNYTITFPTSFFSTTPQVAMATLQSMTSTANQMVGVNANGSLSSSAATLTTGVVTGGPYTGQVYSFFFIGT